MTSQAVGSHRLDESESAKVVVLIINHHGLSDTIACVRAAADSSFANLVFLVLDNGSSEYAALCACLGSIARIIRTDHNLGFAGGSNVGIREALIERPDYILLLNNDVILAKDAIERMVSLACGSPNVAAIGPKTYYADRRNVLICVGGGRVQVWLGRTPLVGYGKWDDGRFDRVTELDWIVGSAMLLSTAALRAVGPFDETFFYGLEDVDMGLRLKQAGYRMLAAPAARAWHKLGTSSTPLFRLTHLLRGYIVITRKHGKPWHRITFWPFFLFVRIPLEARRTIVRHPLETVRAVVSAIAFGLKVVPAGEEPT